MWTPLTAILSAEPPISNQKQCSSESNLACLSKTLPRKLLDPAPTTPTRQTNRQARNPRLLEEIALDLTCTSGQSDAAHPPQSDGAAPTKERSTMRRIILPTLALLTAITVGGYHEWTPAHADTATCSNTLLGDGHGGPWRTHNNGGTLHGNTVVINCPTSSTHWSIRYQIQIVNQGQNAGAVFSTTLSGNGDEQTSYSLSPYPCDPFGYRTHVDNLVTGGNVNMPSGGGSVNVGC